MGIEGLWEMFKGAEKDIRFDELRNFIATDTCKVAIDSNLLIMQNYFSCWGDLVDKGVPNDDTLYGKILSNFKAKKRTFERNNIETIWCFDGEKDGRKLATKKRRDENDEKLQKVFALYAQCDFLIEKFSPISKEELLGKYSFIKDKVSFITEDKDYGEEIPEEINITLIMNKISEMKKKLKSCILLPNGFFECIFSKLKEEGFGCLRIKEISEGEKLASILSHMGVVNAVYGNDSDLIPMKTKFIIKRINENNTVSIFNYQEMLKHIGLTQEQLIKLCVLLGCDYNYRIDRNGPATAMKKTLNDKFDIKEYDLKNPNKVNLENCVRHMTISNEEIMLVQRALN